MLTAHAKTFSMIIKKLILTPEPTHSLSKYAQKGVDKLQKNSPSKAVKLFEKGVMQQELDCYYFLGKMYENGMVKLKSTKIAISLYKYAAQRDHLASANQLAIIYLGKSDVPCNLNKAVYYLNQAAELGGPKEAFNFGRALLIATLDTNHYSVGIDWIHRSAMRGFEPAISMLKTLIDNEIENYPVRFGTGP